MDEGAQRINAVVLTRRPRAKREVQRAERAWARMQRSRCAGGVPAYGTDRPVPVPPVRAMVTSSSPEYWKPRLKLCAVAGIVKDIS